MLVNLPAAAVDSSPLYATVVFFALLLLVYLLYFRWMRTMLRKPAGDSSTMLSRRRHRKSRQKPPRTVRHIIEDPPFDEHGNFIFHDDAHRRNDAREEDYGFLYGNDSGDEEDDERWDTGSRLDTSGADNFFNLAAQEWLSASAAYYLTIQPIYMGVDFPERTSRLYTGMLERLKKSGARAVTLAIAHANLAAKYSAAGLDKRALEQIELALRVFEESCAPAHVVISEGAAIKLENLHADIVMADATAICIEDLHAAGYPEAEEALAWCADVRGMKMPPFRKDLLGILICSRDAARVRVAVPEVPELFAEASAAIKTHDHAEALGSLQRAYDLLDSQFCGSDLRWPLTAACYDLALAKLMTGGQVISGISDMAEARRLHRCCDVPEPAWRAIIEAAADAIVR
jgi:hypothetical protein